jgi:hypothetical protein
MCGRMWSRGATTGGCEHVAAMRAGACVVYMLMDLGLWPCSGWYSAYSCSHVPPAEAVLASNVRFAMMHPLSHRYGGRVHSAALCHPCTRGNR